MPLETVRDCLLSAFPVHTVQNNKRNRTEYERAKLTKNLFKQKLSNSNKICHTFTAHFPTSKTGAKWIGGRGSRVEGSQCWSNCFVSCFFRKVAPKFINNSTNLDSLLHIIMLLLWITRRLSVRDICSTHTHTLAHTQTDNVCVFINRPIVIIMCTSRSPKCVRTDGHETTNSITWCGTRNV